jgi:hypothetical protein
VINCGVETPYVAVPTKAAMALAVLAADDGRGESVSWT